jgi:exodeoxyribonuclease VII large subunit
MRIVGVSELTLYLKGLLEEDYLLQNVWVRGEITNYTQAASGHRYFSLKDASATLRCVLFRNSAAGPLPPMQNGQSVLAHGRMSLYEQRGDYQFYVDGIELAGEGELHLLFEALKAELEAEGLFSPARKRELPVSPSTVGVVTSTSAAALRDIVRTLRIRCPLVRVIVAAARVQGEGAAVEIAAALDRLNAHGEVDVIILARGGGSLEELWAFNEEVVARSIARSQVPVVTGVGHETDFTIADFVADQRASTPTAAAMTVVPDADTWRAGLLDTRERLRHLIEARVRGERSRLSSSRTHLARTSPERILANARQRADESQHRLGATVRHLLELQRERLRGSALSLQSLSPLLTIGRGFAVVRRSADGVRVQSVKDVTPGQGLTIQVSDGLLAATAGPRLAAVTPDVVAESEGRAHTGESASVDKRERRGKRYHAE